MEHEMKLDEPPFNEIKEGRKKIEIRLNDEKRQKVRDGDIIIFRKRDNLNEIIENSGNIIINSPEFSIGQFPTNVDTINRIAHIKVRVTGIKRYGSYREVVEDNNLEDFGGVMSKEDLLNEGIGYYSQEEQMNWGFVVFRISLL